MEEGMVGGPEGIKDKDVDRDEKEKVKKEKEKEEEWEKRRRWRRRRLRWSSRREVEELTWLKVSISRSWSVMFFILCRNQRSILVSWYSWSTV